jgi:phosphoenolpyruvate---glycerone phosphotransferase subunit DhaL
VILDPEALRAALGRWCVQMKLAAPELNKLDGQLGDGDLGATLEKCAANIADVLPQTQNDDLSQILKRCSIACAKASGSSFGTLLATAFLTAAKQCAGRQTIDRKDLAQLLQEVVSALSARGGASLGDKTVLDPIHAVAIAIDSASDDADLLTLAREATNQALDAFRTKPNKIGRARAFPLKSVGLDDPGMVAFKRMLESLGA